MRTFAVFATLAAAATALQSNPHSKVKKIDPLTPALSKRSADVDSDGDLQFLTNKTQPFLVNGTHFPQVPFDIGESYAGLLPNTPHGNSSLFFWFFPSTNPNATKEITIWLNGGPGCSSLDGLLQENGPFLWQSGTYEPIRNAYAWQNLTNIVYIDQPAGTGYSPGPPTVNNEIDVSNEFNDFWRRFIDTFSMQGYKVYITGESYAGMYVPYIAQGFIEQNDTAHFNLKGIQINDPSINDDSVLIYAPAVAAMNHFAAVFNLNESFTQEIQSAADKCGYTEYLEKALTYPPPADFPTLKDPYLNPECQTWDAIVNAVTLVNPCFNIYHLTDFCPFLWDELGFPSQGLGPNNYFNSREVQKALHVPPINYEVCGETDVFPFGDSSAPSALGPLPKVIEYTNNVIIGHGWYDYLLFMNGTLATIQGMTWNGAKGFQKPPTNDLYVPYTAGSAENPVFWDAGAGLLGKWQSERGLTFSSVYGSGHEIPQYVPGAAFRQLELLLGRIDSLSSREPFTTLQ